MYSRDLPRGSTQAGTIRAQRVTPTMGRISPLQQQPALPIICEEKMAVYGQWPPRKFKKISAGQKESPGRGSHAHTGCKQGRKMHVITFITVLSRYWAHPTTRTP
eukprot:jgi/Botrbrau1/2794/Bobra.0125s0006.1